MTRQGGRGEDPFWSHAGLAAGVMAVGLVVAAAFPRVAETRLSALLGVGLSSAVGVLALVLKRRAVRKERLGDSLKVVGLVFGLRAVAMGLGLAWVVSRELGAVPFIGGFFGVYFVLQWIEVSYVMAASKRAAGGDE